MLKEGNIPNHKEQYKNRNICDVYKQNEEHIHNDVLNVTRKELDSDLRVHIVRVVCIHMSSFNVTLTLKYRIIMRITYVSNKMIRS